MIEFTANVIDLKKSISIAGLGTDDKLDSITGLVLFKIQNNNIVLYATNNDKKAMAFLPTTGLSYNENCFATDPDKIGALIGNLDVNQVRMLYDKNTLTVFTSDDTYLAFDCKYSSEFISFEDDFSQAEKIATISTDVLSTGIHYTQGFSATKTGTDKYSNVFITDGILYGTDGGSQIGAFYNINFKDVKKIVLRRLMISAINSMLEKGHFLNVVFKVTAKTVYITSEDDLYAFGFRKATGELPVLPISVVKPTCSGFRVDRKLLIKKLTQLSLTAKEEVGIKAVVKGVDLILETIGDRKSVEKITCDSADYFEEFVLECNRMKKLLALFSAPKIDFYIDKNFIIHSDAELIIEDGKNVEKQSFVEVASIYKARIVS